MTILTINGLVIWMDIVFATAILIMVIKLGATVYGLVSEIQKFRKAVKEVSGECCPECGKWSRRVASGKKHCGHYVCKFRWCIKNARTIEEGLNS